MRYSFYQILFTLAMICMAKNNADCQQYFRISGEMTIKSKSPSGEQAITIGTVYFDRNQRQIIYNITFPEPETWVTTDSLTYRIINDSIVSKQVSIGMAEFSVFNMALNSHLPDFGLQKSIYHIESVEKDGDNIVTTWAPKESMKDKMGNILVSTLNKKLFGVIFMNSSGVVLRKQFFEDYFNISGIAFPGKIVEIGYEIIGESYQISNFRNLKLNELENNTNYNYVLPFGSGS